jgi:hypothetical protein
MILIDFNVFIEETRCSSCRRLVPSLKFAIVLVVIVSCVLFVFASRGLGYHATSRLFWFTSWIYSVKIGVSLLVHRVFPECSGARKAFGGGGTCLTDSMPLSAAETTVFCPFHQGSVFLYA